MKLFQDVNKDILSNEIIDNTKHIEREKDLNLTKNIIGKDELRQLNVMIDQMVNYMLACDSRNYKEEVERTKQTIEKAKHYKKQLEQIIEINIDIDDHKRDIFLKEFSIEKNDTKLKEKYLILKKSMVDKINIFYKQITQYPEKKLKKTFQKKSGENQKQRNLCEINKKDEFKEEKIHIDCNHRSKWTSYLFYFIIIVMITFFLKIIYD